jgi:hypothetical protein
MAACARWCEARANFSMASRVSCHFMAIISADLIWSMASSP